MSSKLSSEAAEQLDLSVLRYSRVLEDHRVLSEGLAVSPDTDTIISITSAGDNVLNLLLERPKKIVALDMSPAQNCLLELKLMGIRHLGYHDYLVLLGETDDTGKQRLAVYQRVKQFLPAYAQAYWESHTEIIRDGLCISSRLQKYFAQYCWTPFSTTVGDQTLDRLFDAQSLEEQRRVFHSLPLDKVEAIMKFLSSKETQKSGRSSTQLKYVAKSSQEVEDEVWAGFTRVCLEVSIKDNFYHSWLCRGKRGFNPEHRPGFAPPCLREAGFQALKGLVDRVEVHTTTLEAYLGQQDSPQIHKANLSNIFEYMSESDAEQVFGVLSDALAPGGRVAYWNLFNPRYPRSCPNLQPLTKLSQDLHKKDRLYYYSEFCVLEKTQN